MGISHCCISRDKRTQDIMRKEMLVQYLKQIERKHQIESAKSSYVYSNKSSEDSQEVGRISQIKP